MSDTSFRFRLAENYSFELANLHSTLHSVISDITRTTAVLGALVRYLQRGRYSPMDLEHCNPVDVEIGIQEKRLLELLTKEREVEKQITELKTEEALFIASEKERYKNGTSDNVSR